MFKRALKFTGKSTLLIGTSCYALTLPSLDSIPQPLLKFRCLCDGFFRMLRVVKLGAEVYYEYHIKNYPLESATQQQWNKAHEVIAHRILDVAMLNGALYIKSAQGIVAASDVVPPPFIRILSPVQADCTPRPYSEVEISLRTELGNDCFEKVFNEFERTPIATASVAQVHRATLKNHDNAEVAVKIQHLDVKHRYESDLAVILAGFRVCGLMFPTIDYSVLIRSCEEHLHKELDFTFELEHMERTRENLKKKWKNDEVCVPFCYKDVSTSSVLISEFIHAVHGNNAEGIKNLGLSLEEVATNLADAIGYQLFEAGFCSPDTHGANILVRPHPTKTKIGNFLPSQVFLIDHGLSYEITPEERRILSDIWTSSVTHDSETLKKIMRDDLNLSDEHYAHFASIFLQFPYHLFAMDKTIASAEEVEECRAGYMDPNLNDLLALFPTNFLLALSTISQHRAVHKSLKNPVSRTARLLRYSLANGTEAMNGGFYFKYFSFPIKLFKLKLFETVAKVTTFFLFLMYPELREVIPDELLQLA